MPQSGAVGQEECAGGLWRSEEMAKLDVVFPRDAVHHALFYVGMSGTAEFIDMQQNATAFQRPYTAEIRRCEDLERRLRYFYEQLTQSRVAITAQVTSPHPTNDGIDRLETVLEERESELRELNTALDALQEELNKCRELLRGAAPQ